MSLRCVYQHSAAPLTRSPHTRVRAQVNTIVMAQDLHGVRMRIEDADRTGSLKRECDAVGTPYLPFSLTSRIVVVPRGMLPSAKGHLRRCVSTPPIIHGLLAHAPHHAPMLQPHLAALVIRCSAWLMQTVSALFPSQPMMCSRHASLCWPLASAWQLSSHCWPRFFWQCAARGRARRLRRRLQTRRPSRLPARQTRWPWRPSTWRASLRSINAQLPQGLQPGNVLVLP